MVQMEQLVVRVSDEMAKAVDELVDAGEYETRSDAVRAAVATSTRATTGSR